MVLKNFPNKDSQSLGYKEDKCTNVDKGGVLTVHYVKILCLHVR